MRVLAGTYEMAVGYGAGSTPPPIAAKMIAAGDLRYEMVDRDSWHYVRPIGGPALTVMVTGRPWSRDAAGAEPGGPLSPLTAKGSAELLGWFRRFYPLPNH